MTASPESVKNVVVSFRVTQAEHDALVRAFTELAVPGIQSPSTLARMLAMDWAEGLLHYPPNYKLMSPEVRRAEVPGQKA